jgi:hypothetical protein
MQESSKTETSLTKKETSLTKKATALIKTGDFWKSLASNVLFYGGAVLGSSLFLAALIHFLVEGELDTTILLIALGTFIGGIPMFLGWKGRQKMKLKTAQANIQKFESTLLKLAKSNRGILTLSSVALKLKISVDEAQEKLNHITSKGLAKVSFDDDGNLNYIFPDFIKKSN